jgi:tetratricopeptide (TPR) repeat protein
LAEALNALGAVFQDSEREPEAEATYRRSIEVYRTPGIDFGVAASDPVANLGVLRYNQGRYDDASIYMQEAIDIRQKYLPPDHPDLMDAEYNYASVLDRKHHEIDAEPIYRRLLALYQRILGPNNIDTLMAQYGVAQNLLRQKRYAEAAETARPAAEGLSRVAGDGHDWTQTAWSYYGLAACLSGQGQEGLTVLHRVAALRREGPDANQWRKSISDVQLGTCLVLLKRFAEAEPLLLEAVASLQSVRGASYDHTQAGYLALRDLYANTGRETESAIWQKKILPGNR